jgi:hypothetical protein
MCGKDRAAGSCPFAATNPDAGALLMCKQDGDCTAGTNGRCGPAGRINGCSCSYDQCFADADCPQGSVCECRATSPSGVGSGTNVCKASNCRVDKDCPGSYCSPSLGSCGNYFGVVGYFCHTPADKCTDDADCAKQGGGDCRWVPTTGAWLCQTSQCAG